MRLGTAVALCQNLTITGCPGDKSTGTYPLLVLHLLPKDNDLASVQEKSFIGNHAAISLPLPQKPCGVSLWFEASNTMRFEVLTIYSAWSRIQTMDRTPPPRRLRPASFPAAPALEARSKRL